MKPSAMMAALRKHALLGALLALLSAPTLANAAAGPAERMLGEELQRKYGDALSAGDLRLMLATPVDGPVHGVQAITYDARSGRFAAILLRERDRVRVEGEAWTETEVTVPARRLTPGEVIGAGDLTTIPLRSDQVSARAVVARHELEGMQVRRVLAAGRPVPAGYVAAPTVVERNKAVTVEFRSGALVLSARGRALEDGGVGDVIRIQNLDSNRTITAVVSGPGTVTASD